VGWRSGLFAALHALLYQFGGGEGVIIWYVGLDNYNIIWPAWYGWPIYTDIGCVDV